MGRSADYMVEGVLMLSMACVGVVINIIRQAETVILFRQKKNSSNYNYVCPSWFFYYFLSQSVFYFAQLKHQRTFHR